MLSTDPNKLTRRMKHLSKTLEKFWTRWKYDYLLELRNSHRKQGIPSQGSSVATGDVIVIHDEHQPRGLWKLGVVTKLMTGKDDKVRAVCVKTRGIGSILILVWPCILILHTCTFCTSICSSIFKNKSKAFIVSIHI